MGWDLGAILCGAILCGEGVCIDFSLPACMQTIEYCKNLKTCLGPMVASPKFLYLANGEMKYIKVTYI
jgi:hypothetical protein